MWKSLTIHSVWKIKSVAIHGIWYNAHCLSFVSSLSYQSNQLLSGNFEIPIYLETVGQMKRGNV